jgi:hypothetical protein
MLKVLKAKVGLIYEVIPLIDKFTEMFVNIIMNVKAHPSIWHTAKIALDVINKYYSFTNHCKVYWVSICMFVLSPFSSFMSDVFFDGVLYPKFKTFYFTHHKWPQEWIDNVMVLLQLVWDHYKPVDAPASELPVLSPAPALVTTTLRPKKSQVDFEIVLNYRQQMCQGSDALEEYLKSPPLPLLTDPIGFWLKQRKAGEATGDSSNTALAQMALDYLSAPGSFFGISFMQ